MTPIFRVTIPGRPVVKKNTKRFTVFRRSPRVFYSPQYKAWEQTAILACRQTHIQKAFHQCLMAKYGFYFKNQHAEADTSNLIEGPQDVLQSAGIIVNDKQIRKVIAEKYFGHEPQTVIELFEYDAKDIL